MATIINADTSAGLKLTSDTSGIVEIQNAGTTKLTVNSSGATVAGTLAATAVTGDGSALTGITSGGMTLLSTVATTSGTEAVAGSLNLSSYHTIMVYVSDVGAAAGGSLFQWKETGGTYSKVAYSNLTSSVPVYAVLNHNLITGVTAINPNSYTATNTNANLDLQAGTGGCGTNTAIDQATTSITFSTVAGQTFNRGQILIYGLK